MQAAESVRNNWRERIRKSEEFRKGEEEFVESLGDCLPCLVKLSLELVESDSKEDRELLKKTLHEIAKNVNSKELRKEDEGILGLGLISATPILSFLRGEPVILPRIRGRK